MIYFLYPRLAKLTGAERYILKLAQYLAREGQPVTIVTHQCAPVCRALVAPDVALIETGYWLNLTTNHYLNAALDYLASHDLGRHIGSNATAACFFAGPGLLGLWYVKAVRRLRIPCFYYAFEPPRLLYRDRAEIPTRLGPLNPVMSRLLALYQRVDRRMIGRADAILTVSEFSQQQIRQVYCLDAYVVTCGSDLTAPIDPTELAALRTRYRLSESSEVILAVNHLHPRKRIDLLLRAMAQVVQKRPQAVALIVGSGPETERLKALSQKLGLEPYVRFPGFVPESELPAHYALSDVYVHTAKEESLGLVILEAAGLGLPIVAVNEGGPCEIVLDGCTGFLVPATPEALAEKILYLLSHKDIARQMGRAGAEYTRNKFQWQKGARQFIEVLQAVHCARVPV